MSRLHSRPTQVDSVDSNNDTGLLGSDQESEFLSNAFAQQQMPEVDGDPLDDGIAWGDNSATARVRAS